MRWEVGKYLGGGLEFKNYIFGTTVDVQRYVWNSELVALEYGANARQQTENKELITGAMN